MGYSNLILSFIWAIIGHTILGHAYDRGNTCQHTFANDIPTPFGLPPLGFVPKLGKPAGDWLNPIDKLMIESPQLPLHIELPSPLLPTENRTILTLYHQAITAYVHDLHTSEYDLKATHKKYVEDAQCWLHQYICRSDRFPWNACFSTNEATELHWDDSNYSKKHSELTISLLKRSHFIALVDLGKSLVPIINQNEDDDLTDDEMAKRGIPKFAIHISGLVKFYESPVHVADHKSVSEPHLPLNIALPQPLLSKTDTALLTMYRDALNAYDEDRKHSEHHRRRQKKKFQDRAWYWIISDPCYYATNLCNVGDGFSKTLVGNFMPGHDAEGKKLRAEMVRQGLVDLGDKLIKEAKKGGGSPADLKLALGFALDKS